MEMNITDDTPLATALEHVAPHDHLSGETEWILCGAPGLERWAEYESRLSQATRGGRCAAKPRTDARRWPQPCD